MKSIIPILLFMTACSTLSLDKWSFGSDRTMEDETVFFSSDIESRSARLLFKPDKVLSVKAANGSVNYAEGKDYTVDYVNGALLLTENSRIPCTPLCSTEKHGNYSRFKNSRGEYMLFSEGSFFHDLQVKVTYTHSGGEWDGKAFIPRSQASKIQTICAKFENKETCNIVLIGDSISAGANASKKTNAAPYLPPYGTQLIERLETITGAKLNYKNLSVGGKASGWGLENIDKVKSHQPDLVIIAFGMNDGPAEAYQQNTRKMIQALQRHNKDISIILVASMLPNNEFSKHQGHFEKRDKLFELSSEFKNVAVADVMSVCEEILKRKKFADICGNNVNHPNDFIHRLYTDVVLRILGY